MALVNFVFIYIRNRFKTVLHESLEWSVRPNVRTLNWQLRSVHFREPVY